jgi:hypothetical protein
LAFDASAPLSSPGGIKQHRLLLSAIDTGDCHARVVQGACFEGLKDLGHLRRRGSGGGDAAQSLAYGSTLACLACTHTEIGVRHFCRRKNKIGKDGTNFLAGRVGFAAQKDPAGCIEH